MEVSMNDDVTIARELKGIFLSDSEIDRAVDAYLNSDLAELGRILATYINRELSLRSIRVTLTKKGEEAVNNAQVHPEFQNILARFQGGTL
jgi:hypothetical protein